MCGLRTQINISEPKRSRCNVVPVARQVVSSSRAARAPVEIRTPAMMRSRTTIMRGEHKASCHSTMCSMYSIQHIRLLHHFALAAISPVRGTAIAIAATMSTLSRLIACGASNHRHCCTLRQGVSSAVTRARSIRIHMLRLPAMTQIRVCSALLMLI